MSRSVRLNGPSKNASTNRGLGVGMLLTLVAGLAVSPASAAVLEVGSGQTYNTVQGAYNNASAGDTINIHDGTYTDDLDLSSHPSSGADNVTFQANTRADGRYDKVVIENTGKNGNYMRGEQDLTFRGMTLSGTGNANHAVYLRGGFSGGTFEDVIFHSPNGDGLYSYGGGAGATNNMTVENATFFGMSSDALEHNSTNEGWTVKDSLFINNGSDNNEDYGADVRGSGSTGGQVAITDSAFFDNAAGPVGGETFSVGSGSTTDVEPIFASTDIDDPDFLRLDPSSPASIRTGDSDGSYKGARAVVPEPTTLALLGLGGLLAMPRRRTSR